MKTHTIVAILILIIGSMSLLVTKLVMSFMEDRQSIALSDARFTKGSIRIGMDNWVGYFPLCSPLMKRRLYQQGYKLECIDDQAEYRKRMQALAEHKLDLAVATVDAYIVNGADSKFPGKIIAVLDESKGGDALLAWKNKIASIATLQKADQYQIAFTPDSPSDHLLKAIAVHFDIETLKQRKNWPVVTQGSEHALRLLLDRQVDAAVLWEPDVSRALQEKGIGLLLGTEQINRLIVDVLIAGKAIMKERPEALFVLLSEYFFTLKHYRENDQELREDLQQATDLSQTSIANLLRGVAWQNLGDNAEQWFAVASSSSVPELALIESIDSSIDILQDYGSLTGSPLPDADPYRIINSQYIDEVYQQLGLKQKPEAQQQPKFKTKTEQQWQNMKPLGRLKIRPVIFASGTDHLTIDDKRQLDKAAETLKHYPDFRILVHGHTSVRGDKQLNLHLSQDRADAVARYLRVTYDIPAERMHAIGFGAQQPLAKKSGESRRSWQYRLPRVELLLVTENL